MLERRSAPEVIAHALKIGSFALRECAVSDICDDMSIAMPPHVVKHWQRYIQGKPEILIAQMTNKEWDAIGEFCMELCECCEIEPTFERVNSCIIRLMASGSFLSRYSRSVYEVSPAQVFFFHE